MAAFSAHSKAAPPEQTRAFAAPVANQAANAFTVDVEDYFQVTAFENDIPRNQWDDMPGRVVESTTRILELLDRCGVRGTFFVLGWVADRHPQLVLDIAAAGHEVGSHSYWHRLTYELSPREFREDLRRSRDVLQDISGQPVDCYRAPTFSITRNSLWALEILVEEGFRIDSSIFPIRHDRYGVADAETGIHQLPTPAGPLWEFPPSVCRLCGVNIPVSGGGYFRLYPWALTRACLQRCGGRPFMFYTHPWEIDPQQPRLPAGSRLSRFRHYVNLSRTEAKLEKLLKTFCFAPLGEVIQTHIHETHDTLIAS